MSFADGLYTYCSDNLSVGERVYPLTLPEGAQLPALVYQVITSQGPLHTHSSAQSGSGQPSIYQRIRVQFSCWADDFDAAEQLGDELTQKLDGYRGQWGDLRIGSVLFEGPQDDHDPQLFIWRRLLDALIQYTGGADGS
jgi:hypothetical protein